MKAMEQELPATVTFTPIGYVRTTKRLKFDAPHQPSQDSVETNLVVLNPGHQFELALQDLDGFDRIWLVCWFDKNTTWRPRALPPRGPAKRRGVFATRSPHRPNSIGLTCVQLLSIDGLELTVGPLDLIDGTPILDIKPYLSTVDSFPESSLGWVGEVEELLLNSPPFDIQISDVANRQLEWLRSRWNIDFTERAFSILRIDPTPHRTRRILHIGEGLYRMACGPWRLYFRVEGQIVTIESINKGYADESLVMVGREKITDREAQIEFSQTQF